MQNMKTGLFSLLLCSSLSYASGWTYSGSEGPENWGKLSPDYAMCNAGRNQSPVNIEGVLDAPLAPLKTTYGVAGKEILNNGHTVQVNFAEGNRLTLDGAEFSLKQVHFHAPSENEIKGKSFPLEAHFVHADDKGNLAVIAVMLKEGKANAALTKLWAQISTEESEAVALNARVTPGELMPKNRAYYRFSGSLTTPPCSEGVRWLVLRDAITASTSQIEAFEHAVHHHNNRPIQELNGRVIVK